ncbi:ketopantoate reductase family protein [Desulfobacca acetoxidans]|uniref:2-dehydropantoate 2-reductase n=1 Tax=Desulfobacca acetoxidans (strain ATCC 700848 / DSM 11109 / ASRB2) TaxID=880072 RepID=F2NGJ5_DESAR|nr:2-dehydropantoate 2-reductase [Desulfobacca acetoxidans]AEB07902.1 2-dehydropantoate 2-reductase [Desulfobacca acetoxidans DSM 11109]
MKIAIIGPGAMGLFFAARLQESGQEVWLLDYRPERTAHLKQHALRLITLDGEDRDYYLNVVYEAHAIGPCDLTLVTVKAHQTEAAAAQLPLLMADGGVALTLQNGIGNLETMAAVVGPERLLAGVTTLGVTLLEIGRIRHAGQGPVLIGRPPGALVTDETLRLIVEVFRGAGLDCRETADIMAAVWDKLLINVGINSVTALTRLRNGQLLIAPEAWRVASAAVQEAWQTALASGVKPSPEPLSRMRQVCQATANNRSSMLQDVLAKRQTEIDAINGQIVRLGITLQVATPINALLTDLIKALELGLVSGATNVISE